MIKDKINESVAVHQAMLVQPDLLNQIEVCVRDISDALSNGNKLILCGNGGSFADAQHISAEFTSRFLVDRQSLPSIALGCNCSSMSAIANDYGYVQSFSRELSSIANKGDVFIPISTSGNSPNIIEAINQANKQAITTVGLTGNKKGKMTELCQCIEVPSGSTPRIQECHILIGHIICEMVEAKL